MAEKSGVPTATSFLNVDLEYHRVNMDTGQLEWTHMKRMMLMTSHGITNYIATSQHLVERSTIPGCYTESASSERLVIVL